MPTTSHCCGGGPNLLCDGCFTPVSHGSSNVFILLTWSEKLVPLPCFLVLWFLSHFLITGHNTQHPQLKGREVYFDSQFQKFQSVAGQAQTQTSRGRHCRHRNPAHIMVAEKQSEGRSQEVSFQVMPQWPTFSEQIPIPRITIVTFLTVFPWSNHLPNARDFRSNP